MRQITYALQFQGRTLVTSPGDRTVRITAFAPSCTVTTLLGPDGVASAVEPVPGARATCEMTVVSAATSRPRGAATVTFGPAGHRLHLRLRGHSALAGGTAAVTCCALVWHVVRGEGQFADAAGLIASHLVIDARGAVTDTQFGVITLLAAPGGAEVDGVWP
ncbi:MAG TPA: hypothetical protein VFU72_12665 [Nitrolancea sp.]|nr:hypothetical protein [Nitrolancea sp.]